jgi:hypothetical protein
MKILEIVKKETIFQIARMAISLICALESFWFHFYLSTYHKRSNPFNQQQILEKIGRRILSNPLCPFKNLALVLREHVQNLEQNHSN